MPVWSGIVFPLSSLVLHWGVLFNPGATNTYGQIGLLPSLVCQLCPILEWRIWLRVSHALSTSKLDYYNVLHMGLPLKTVQKLPLVQDARALSGTARYEHPTHMLKQLLWLPIHLFLGWSAHHL